MQDFCISQLAFEKVEHLLVLLLDAQNRLIESKIMTSGTINQTAGVAIIVDGVYLNRTGLGLNDLTDIARVEVLQGPQGTLYGKNANAGVVNIPQKPYICML